MASESPNPFEWGQLLEKVDTLIANQAEQKLDIASLKKSMSTGWGVFIGAAAVIGLFANELVAGVKSWLVGGS